MSKSVSPVILKHLIQFQRDEITGNILYHIIAAKQKDEENRRVLVKIANAERSHYEKWKDYTGKDAKPRVFKIFLFKIISFLLGYTFTIKYMDQAEKIGIRGLKTIEKEVPEARAILADEKEHEDRLMELLDEERLHYVGAMVFGLNDALVGLTGTLAGLTFALESTHLVALSGIITGISATLSTAASNYLVAKFTENKKALISCIYTGVVYLITVALMIIPYLLLPNSMYITACAIMLSIAILIILFFSYYISVAQSLPFLKRFGEMVFVSLGVAFISFLIGLAAKKIIGINA